MQTKLTNAELWQCMRDAEDRKANPELPICHRDGRRTFD
jgi:hypothetical protein